MNNTNYDDLQNGFENNHQNKKLSKKATLFFCGLLILVAGIFLYWTFTSEPEAQREGAAKQTAMLVDVKEVKRGNYKPLIRGLGTVEPAKDIYLSARVDGEVTHISSNFLPGGFVDKDEILLTIDQADYKNIVQQHESELAQAKSNLNIERGRRDVAEKEYQLLNQKLSDENRALVLREPQLESARAEVASAQAALDQAKLNLERTVIKAPFHAQILNKHVNKGSQVSPQAQLARLIGVDTYWIIVSVPVAHIERIAFPDEQSKGATVKIQNRTAWQENQFRTGHVKSLIGALDDTTRMARVLITVDDPLAIEEQTKGPELIVGSVVQSEIEGQEIENVFRIDRDFVRENESVWVKKNGKLDIRDVSVVFRDSKNAYISSGLKDGEHIVTSNLATVATGVELRTESSESSAEEAQ